VATSERRRTGVNETKTETALVEPQATGSRQSGDLSRSLIFPAARGILAGCLTLKKRLTFNRCAKAASRSQQQAAGLTTSRWP
jgi:hypothetical protein